MVHVFPAIEVLLIGLLQKALRRCGSVMLPHENVLLVDNGVVRQERNGARHRGNQGVEFLLIAAECRRQLHLPAHADVTPLREDNLPAHADVTPLREDNAVPAVHHGEVVSDVYLLHTFDRIRMNFGRRFPAMKRERPFSP